MALKPLRVVLVEDEGLYREMLTTCLAGQAGIEVVGAYANSDQALKEGPELRPDVAILDFELPGSLHGIELGLALRRRLPRIGIVLLSNHAVPHLLSTISPEIAWGWAYLVKKAVADIAGLRRAIDAVAAGIVALDSSLMAAMRPRPGSAIEQLSADQRGLLDLVAQGYSDLAIAEILNISRQQTEQGLQDLYTELGIDTANRHIQPRVRAVLRYLSDTRTRWSAGGLHRAG